MLLIRRHNSYRRVWCEQCKACGSAPFGLVQFRERPRVCDRTPREGVLILIWPRFQPPLLKTMPRRRGWNRQLVDTVVASNEQNLEHALTWAISKVARTHASAPSISFLFIA